MKVGEGSNFVRWGTAPPFSDPLGWCACTDLLNTYYWVLKIMFSEKFAENQRTFVGVRTEIHTHTHPHTHIPTPIGSSHRERDKA